MLVPSMPLAAARTSSKLRQNLTPPDLPRPPAWICALTIHWEPPSALAASTAASGELATLPGGTAMPYCANSSLAWYSWKFIRYLERTEKRWRPHARNGAWVKGVGRWNDTLSERGVAARHWLKRTIRPPIFAEAGSNGKGARPDGPHGPVPCGPTGSRGATSVPARPSYTHPQPPWNRQPRVQSSIAHRPARTYGNDPPRALVPQCVPAGAVPGVHRPGIQPGRHGLAATDLAGVCTLTGHGLPDFLAGGAAAEPAQHVLRPHRGGGDPGDRHCRGDDGHRGDARCAHRDRDDAGREPLRRRADPAVAPVRFLCRAGHAGHARNFRVRLVPRRPPGRSRPAGGRPVRPG